MKEGSRRTEMAGTLARPVQRSSFRIQHSQGATMRKVIRSSDAPQPRGPYSPAIVAEGFVFVAGQGPVNPRTNELELGDIRDETRRTLENIRAILTAAGSSLREVVRVGVFLADMKDFQAMNEVYREFFPEDPPARTTVGAQLPKIKVEIDCIARLRKARKR
jgi:2-iminobutanoate/2-iminopropanoate deaminase